MTAAPPPDDPVQAACGDAPGAICEAVWNATENEGLAKAADWFIGRPLTIAAIVVVAAVLTRLGARAVRRGLRRLAVNQQVAARALQRAGVGSAPSASDQLRQAGRTESIAGVVTSTVTVLIWIVALLLVVGELGLDLAPLIAGAGIAGVAVGFGAQSLVKDCITGLFMLIEDQYGVGDTVDLGDAVGVVERITLRTTVLRGVDGTVWHVPNGEIRRVGNRSQQWALANVDVAVAYDADLTAARRVLQEVADAVCASPDHSGDVVQGPELLGVETVRPDAITLRIQVKTVPGAQFRLQRVLLETAKQELDRAGVKTPVAAAPAAAPVARADPPPGRG